MTNTFTKGNAAEGAAEDWSDEKQVEPYEREGWGRDAYTERFPRHPSPWNEKKELLRSFILFGTLHVPHFCSSEHCAEKGKEIKRK